MTPSPDTTGAVERLAEFASKGDVILLDRNVPALRADILAALSEITSLREALRGVVNGRAEFEMREIARIALARLKEKP